MTGGIVEIGRLKKGDPCVVRSLRGRTIVYVRVTKLLSVFEEYDACSRYECTTPGGSVITSGAAWVHLADEEDLRKLERYEQEQKEIHPDEPLYGGKL